MGGFDHPYHPLRMTDGGSPRTHPCPSSVHGEDRCGVFAKTREKKKKTRGPRGGLGDGKKRARASALYTEHWEKEGRVSGFVTDKINVRIRNRKVQLKGLPL
jgi:hypothetical protein